MTQHYVVEQIAQILEEITKVVQWETRLLTCPWWATTGVVETVLKTVEAPQLQFFFWGGLPPAFKGVDFLGAVGLPGQGSKALQKCISELSVEQFVDIPCGGLQDFRPGQSSPSSSHVPAGISEVLDEPGEGFFRTFPPNKKGATQPPHSR